MSGLSYRRTVGEYQAAFRAAFGPKNKRRVLMQAAKDPDLSISELDKLQKWARRQGFEIPEDEG